MQIQYDSTVVRRSGWGMYQCMAARHWWEYTDDQLDIGGSCGSRWKPKEGGEDSPTLDIEIFGATVFDDLLASDETIDTLALPIGERSGLLGGTMEVTTLGNPGKIEITNPKRWTSEQGAAAVVAAEEHPHILEWLLPAGCVMIGVVDLRGFALFWANHLTCNSRAFLPIIPNLKLEIKANTQMLEQVLYLLMMEVVSLWDTRTMWVYSADIWQRFLHRTDQLTMR